MKEALYCLAISCFHSKDFFSYGYTLNTACISRTYRMPGLDKGTPTGDKIPGRYIPVGSGFVVRPLQSGSTVLTFDNNQRAAEAPLHTFFGDADKSSFDLLRLQLKTPTNIVLGTTVAYDGDWSHGFARDDSRHPGLTSLDLFYSFADDQQVIINGRSAFSEDDMVPLGYRAYESGEYEIRIRELQGVFEDRSVYLKDLEAGVVVDLTENEYSFSTAAGDFTNRFQIVYQPQETMVTDDALAIGVVVYRRGEHHMVRSTTSPIRSLDLYDASGRMIMSINGENRKEIELPTAQFSNGVYYLRITTANAVISKKVRI